MVLAALRLALLVACPLSFQPAAPAGEVKRCRRTE
jgi:hypothetical protein